MANLRVGGIITIKVNGSQLAAKGNFSYNLGKPKREAVMGTDGFHGFKEAPQVAFIEGEVTDKYELDLSRLVAIENATVLLDLANGKSVVLNDAYFAGDGNGETEEGKIAVRFEGPSAKEIK